LALTYHLIIYFLISNYRINFFNFKLIFQFFFAFLTILIFITITSTIYLLFLA